MADKAEVQGIDDCGQRDSRDVSIIRGSVDVILLRESISWGKFHTRKDLPDKIKILKERDQQGCHQDNL